MCLARGRRRWSCDRRLGLRSPWPAKPRPSASAASAPAFDDRLVPRRPRHRSRHGRGSVGLLRDWPEPAGIWRRADARMLCRIPDFEQPTASKLAGTARNFVWIFHTLRQRRRIGNLHLHGCDSRHREIATIERSCDQGEGAGLRREIDGEPVARRQFFVECRNRLNAPDGFPASGPRSSATSPTKTPCSPHDTLPLPRSAAIENARNPGIASMRSGSIDECRNVKDGWARRCGRARPYRIASIMAAPNSSRISSAISASEERR